MAIDVKALTELIERLETREDHEGTRAGRSICAGLIKLMEEENATLIQLRHAKNCNVEDQKTIRKLKAENKKLREELEGVLEFIGNFGEKIMIEELLDRLEQMTEYRNHLAEVLREAKADSREMKDAARLLERENAKLRARVSKLEDALEDDPRFIGDF